MGQQQQQSAQQQIYEINKITTIPPNATVATAVTGSNNAPKTNGFTTATTTAPHQQQFQQQQIDKVTGQPVPAPRRANSIPLGDALPEASSANGDAVTSSDSANKPTSLPAAGTNTAKETSAEAQVCSGRFDFLASLFYFVLNGVSVTHLY